MYKKKKNYNFKISSYFSKYKIAIIFYIITNIISYAAATLEIIFIAKGIEQITLGFMDEAVKTFIVLCGLVIIQHSSWLIVCRLFQKYSNKIMSDIRGDLAGQSFKLNSQTYSNHNTGTMLQRIVNDPQVVVRNLDALLDSLTQIMSSLVIVIYIATLNFYMGIGIFAIIVVCFVIEFFRRKVMSKNNKMYNKKLDDVTSFTTEIVKSEKDIKALGLENKLKNISNKMYKEFSEVSDKKQRQDLYFWGSRNFIIDLSGYLLLLCGIFMIDLGMLTLATFMVIYVNNSKIYDFVINAGVLNEIVVETNVGLDRMRSLFDNKEFKCESFGDKTLTNVQGAIEFKNVSFYYDENKTEYNDNSACDKNKNIFNNLTFKIQPHTTVAFVGKSGSGKSTILNIISKMYTVSSGEVLIDNVNINELDKHSLRTAISLVNQFPYIFDMSIKDNLLLIKEDATDDELEKVLKDASLYDFVNSLPDGINTKVGESGIKLSGGQRQRLAIARALLRKSPIIIFDESTSSLDNFAQNDIKNSIDNLKGQSTIIIVAHRLSTIKNVDKIFFLDEGQIVDVGTFDELFKNNVKFKNMFFAENLN